MKVRGRTEREREREWTGDGDERKKIGISYRGIVCLDDDVTTQSLL